MSLGGWGGEQAEEAGAVEGAEHLHALVAFGSEFAPEGGHVGLLGNAGRQDEEHALGAMDGFGGDGFGCGPIDIENLVDGGAETLAEAGAGFLVERIEAGAEIAFEEGQDFGLGGKRGGDGAVVGQEGLQGDGSTGVDAFEDEEFAEGEAVEGVGGLAAGEVGLGALDVEEGRAAVDDAEGRELVVEVLDLDRPVGEAVDFVEKKGGEAVGVEVNGEIFQAAGREPEVVEARVEGGGRADPEGFAEVLEHEGGLAGAAGTLDADQAVGPVDLRVQVAVESAGSGPKHPVGGLEELGGSVGGDGGRGK